MSTPDTPRADSAGPAARERLGPPTPGGYRRRASGSRTGRSPAAGLPGPGAERPHGTRGACRNPGVAHLATVRLDQVAEAGPLGARHDLRQLGLDVVGIVGLREAEPLRHPEDVRVYRDARHAEGVAQARRSRSCARLPAAPSRSRASAAPRRRAARPAPAPCRAPIGSWPGRSRSIGSLPRRWPDRRARSPRPAGTSRRGSGSPGSRARPCTGRPGSWRPGARAAS